MFACISPCVSVSASTLRMKTRRRMKLPGRMGWTALRSASTRAASAISVAISTLRNAEDPQPKFWPKDGMHSIRLKKISTSAAPGVSK